MSSLMREFLTWLAAGLRRAELSRLDESELRRIAGDAGVTPGELADLAAEGARAAVLLPRRIRAQGLDMEAIARSEPGTLRDMQRVCSHCGERDRCEHDLHRDAQDRSWQSYCPNAPTLRALEIAARRQGVTPP